jgi:hypothetical protein
MITAHHTKFKNFLRRKHEKNTVIFGNFLAYDVRKQGFQFSRATIPSRGPIIFCVASVCVDFHFDLLT